MYICKNEYIGSHFIGKIYLEAQENILKCIYILLTSLVNLYGVKAVSDQSELNRVLPKYLCYVVVN